jgi:hypothetical protein
MRGVAGEHRHTHGRVRDDRGGGLRLPGMAIAVGYVNVTTPVTMLAHEAARARGEPM